MTALTQPSASLGRRAVYALLLMIGFYLLALGIAGALLYLPYAEWHYVGRVEIRLAFFSVATAFAILAAVTPRIDAFEAPGPELAPGDHPRLFGLINEIAAATEQAQPKHVYLVPDLNAWVAQRGGIMGFGSVRVMGVGLPLLQTLTLQEFSAVLAHEFGHFHGGDTMLGPWIYKTRSAIGRTLEAFSQKHTWLAKPFEWYGNLFLRITHSVSRQQEYAADALAARVVGASALATGLKSIHAYAPVFPNYWQSEVLPALQAGYRPPIGQGFQNFVASPTIAPAVATLLQAQLKEGNTDPFDTHPPLGERLSALQIPTDTAPAASGEMAVSLLNQPDTLEDKLLAHLLPNEIAARLKPAPWEDLGNLVYLPSWRELVSANRSRLTSVSINELPSLASPPGALAVRLQLAATPSVATERNIAESRYLVGAALALALHARGFPFSTLVGEPIIFTVGTTSLHPFQVMERLSDGSLTLEAWKTLVSDANLESQPLLMPQDASVSAKAPGGA